mgnify:FL=1
MSDRTALADDDPRNTLDCAIHLDSALHHPMPHANTSEVDCCFYTDSTRPDVLPPHFAGLALLLQSHADEDTRIAMPSTGDDANVSTLTLSAHTATPDNEQRAASSDHVFPSAGDDR